MREITRFVFRPILGVMLILAAMPQALADPNGGGDVSANARVVYPALFGTTETYSPDTSDFFKWTGLLTRFEEDLRHADRPCNPHEWDACEPAEWRDLVRALSRLDLLSKVQLVNASVNRHPYVTSVRNWGEDNYWETPFEFFHKNGQCQDYATAKYLLLRAAGVPSHLLRVVLVHDTDLDLVHAVTIVYVNGRALMLDNQFAQVVAADAVRHYRPYYSINETGWWWHHAPSDGYFAQARSDEAAR